MSNKYATFTYLKSQFASFKDDVALNVLWFRFAVMCVVTLCMISMILCSCYQESTMLPLLYKALK